MVAAEHLSFLVHTHASLLTALTIFNQVISEPTPLPPQYPKWLWPCYKCRLEPAARSIWHHPVYWKFLCMRASWDVVQRWWRGHTLRLCYRRLCYRLFETVPKPLTERWISCCATRNMATNSATGNCQYAESLWAQTLAPKGLSVLVRRAASATWLARTISLLNHSSEDMQVKVYKCVKHEYALTWQGIGQWCSRHTVTCSMRWEFNTYWIPARSARVICFCPLTPLYLQFTHRLLFDQITLSNSQHIFSCLPALFLKGFVLDQHKCNEITVVPPLMLQKAEVWNNRNRVSFPPSDCENNSFRLGMVDLTLRLMFSLERGNCGTVIYRIRYHGISVVSRDIYLIFVSTLNIL